MMSMAQPFTQHPGMPGIPHGGQPMVQGHPSSQGIPGGHQPGVSMGQQMHPGMAGPGVPQVSQAGPMMGGMMPGGGPPGVSGGGPNAHALSHLTPHQGQMNPQFAAQQQQQMQVIAQNPQLFQQQQQRNQQMLQQRQLQQQQLQQQAAQHLQQQPNGGMMSNNGGPPMNQGQFIRGNPALQGVPGVALPPHLQQQQIRMQEQHAQQLQQEQARRQQQQAVAQQQAQQQQQQQLQHNQQNAQQQQQQQAQHQQAAQQAQHQAQQQQALHAQQIALQQASQAATAQGQPAPQQQMAVQNQAPSSQDPQSMEAQQRHHQQQQQQQHAQMQDQARRQREQQNQVQQQQQQQQQVQQQAQQQAQQQQQQQPRPDQGQQQQQPGNQQPPNPQQQQAQQQAAQQIHHAQMQQRQAAMLQNQMHGQISRAEGPIMKLFNFASELSQPMASPRSQMNVRLEGQHQGPDVPRDLKQWQRFVDHFFSVKGLLRQALWSSTDQSTKTFETPTAMMARYFFTQFNSGVRNIQMILEGIEGRRLPNGGCFVESSRCTYITWFVNGHNLQSIGTLRAYFDPNEKIDVLDFQFTEHNEYIPRQALLQAAESPEIKHSPNQSKATGKRAQQRQKQQQLQDQSPQITVPDSILTDYGVTKSTQAFLEIGEAISLMSPLISFSHQHKHLSSSQALAQYCQQIQSPQIPQMHQTPNPSQNPQFSAQMHHPSQQAHLQNPAAQNFASFQANNAMHNPQNTNFLSPAAPPHIGLPHQSNSHGNSNSNPSASPATLTHSNQPTPSMQNQLLQHSMGVPMAAQGSHQGTSAGATPAGGSPNVSGKKRRASGVGLGMGVGGDADGVEVNGVGGGKVKQSPRPGGKRQKGGG